jgi:Lar family restriction alleviation protein
MPERCVCCGEIIPEGRQVCPNCENKPSVLKPCPFCGGEADFLTENFGAKVWVVCTDCGVQTLKEDTNLIVFGKGGKDRAIEAWNRREEDATG